VHELVSNWLKDNDLHTPELKNFIEAYKAHGSKPIEVEPEEPYESKKHKYSGTFDWVEADASGELVIADLKVTNQMYPEHALQLAAYATLYNEKHGTSINKGRIYRIDKKTGRVQIKEYENLDKDFKVFKSLIPVWRWVNE
jgi:CRISPR/Cas system-associated exonuclease Cas4 (RecB family)